MSDDKPIPGQYSSANPKNYCPTTAGETYSMGISIMEEVFQIWVILIESCLDSEIEKMLRKLANLGMKETKLFNSWLNYELNCAYASFYESNGTIIPVNLTSEELRILTPEFQQALNKYGSDLNHYKNYFMQLSSQEINERQLFMAGIEVRELCQRLFEDCSRFYPEGEIRNAFLNMAEILAENNVIARNEYARNL